MTEPGDGWIVDAEGPIVFGLDGAPMLSELPDAELRRAAQSGAR